MAEVFAHVTAQTEPSIACLYEALRIDGLVFHPATVRILFLALGDQLAVLPAG